MIHLHLFFRRQSHEDDEFGYDQGIFRSNASVLLFVFILSLDTTFAACLHCFDNLGHHTATAGPIITQVALM